MQYRRVYIPGGSYFFTVVTHQRLPVFAKPDHVALLKQTILNVQAQHPFTIEALVILPDHVHTLWTLPDEDKNYSLRWNQIKGTFSRVLNAQEKHKQCIWQRRFWEHTIRNERDYAAHMDYIHFNPVKHGLVQSPKDWPYSTFHKLVRQGIYPKYWGGDGNDRWSDVAGKE